MFVEPTTVVARAQHLASNAIDDDLVILNLQRDTYVALDPIGRRIWELLEAPRRVDELCRQLNQEFDGRPDEIAADTLVFLNELNGDGMLTIVDARSA